MSQGKNLPRLAKTHRRKARLIGVTSAFDLSGQKTYRAMQRQMPTPGRSTLNSSVNAVTRSITGPKAAS